MNIFRCIVFGASPDTAPDYSPEIYPGDLVISADGGMNLAAELGIRRDVIIGDFDSAEFPAAADTDCEIIRLPREKDVTDMFAAVQLGYERGFRRFELIGGFGGRFDHTLANLQVLLWLAKRGAEAILNAGNQKVQILHSGGENAAKLTLSAEHSGYFSVFAVSGTASGVSISGAKYELREACLTDDFPLGVSNEYIGNDICISIRQGSVIVVQ